jgi:hypothetical protein
MFNYFETESEGLDDAFQPGAMYGYPQAFTRYGNIQAETPMPAFQARVALLNEEVRSRRRNSKPPIECHNFQCYNYESHRTRSSASTHAAQTGPLTAMLAGSICYPKPSSKFLSALHRYHASGNLPFQDLEEKILKSNLSIGAQFRKEVVYIIKMDNLTTEVRKSGR